MKSHAKATVAVTVLLFILAIGTGLALAAQVYVPAQTFSGPGSDPGQLDSPRRAAVEQATGNLFVADSGNGRVQVFDEDGNFLTAFGEGELDAPFGLAIYESGGETEIYVSDPATEQIVRYDSDEAATPSFSLDAGFTSPTAGAGQLKVGDFAAPLAVDPTSGDLWVADPADDRVQRYGSSGTFELANDGSDSPAGAFTGLLDIGADSAGRLYVVDADGFVTNQPDGSSADGQSRVERFAADGAHQLTLAGMTRPATVAVDLVTDRVAVSADQDNVDYNGEPSLHVFDSAGAKFDDLRMGSATQFTTVHGLAWHSGDEEVFSVNDVGYWGGEPLGSPSINRFEPADEPTAAIDPVTNVGAFSADFSGTVNPGGHTTTAHFEISGDGGESWIELEELTVCEVAAPGDCTGDEVVNFSASGLTPNLGYQVRLVAESSVGTATSDVGSFSTLPAPPRVQTGDAIKRTDDSAVLTGRVDPYGLPTTYYFEYGTSPGSYTTSVPASEDGDAGDGQGMSVVTEQLTGLAPGTTYYFRLVATSSEGTVLGGESSFATVGAGEILADEYAHVGFFGTTGNPPSSEPGKFNSPRHLEVQDSTGIVYVVDQGAARISMFSTEGDSAAFLGSFGEGTLVSPHGIAIDQQTGAVYVSDGGAGQIFKFDSDGESTPSFSFDPGFTSPGQGSAADQIADFYVDIEVDPTDGELVVGDNGNARVQRFAASGTHIPSGSFDGASSGEPFTAVSEVAVDEQGRVIVVDPGSKRIERFSATGDHQLSVPWPSAPAATMVEVDPNTGYILVGQDYGWFGGTGEPERISVYDGAQLVSEVHTPAKVPGGGEVVQINGFDVRKGGGGRLYVVSDQLFGCCGYIGGFIFRAGVAPAVSIDPASSVTSSGAHFSGSVTPKGTETTWWFEYSRNGTDWLRGPRPLESAGDGMAPVPVEFDATGLEPNTEYQLRLVAESAIGQRTADAPSFTTATDAPTIGNQWAAPRTTDAARLNARVNPHGLATTYYFEFGEDETYGQTFPATLDGDAGDGAVPVLAAHDLSGLAPATEYHFRLVAESSAGVSEGPDISFTTRTEEEMTPIERGIELINQPDKGGQPVFRADLAENGKVFWATQGGAPGAPTGQGSFVSERTLDTPTGWSTRSWQPHITKLTPDATYPPYPAMMSADGEEGIVLVNYLDRSLGIERLGPEGRTVLQVFSENGLRDLMNLNVPSGYEASDDLGRVYVSTWDSFDPEHGPDRVNIYDIGDGSPELVSRMPDGSVPACGVQYGFSDRQLYGGPGRRWISADGSKIAFSSRGNDCEGADHLYVRDVETETTTLISGPTTSGREFDAKFARMNVDGSQVVFTTATRIAADDVNDSSDLYRWTEGTGTECLTCSVPEAAVGDVAASEELTHVYFLSRKALLRGQGEMNPAGGSNNLYVWHAGEVHYVSPFGSAAGDVEDLPGYSGETDISPDGRTLFFLSRAQATADDPGDCPGGPCLRVYRYHHPTGELECVSCPPPGPGPYLGGHLANGSAHHYAYSAMVTDDGESYAFGTNDALVPEDINETSDIYEWRNGRIALVTDGVTEFPDSSVRLYGITPDGSDIVFGAGANLTGFEEDPLGQLYSAHAGSDIRPPVPPAECSEDSCQGPLVTPPPLLAPGSNSLSGPGNQPGARKARKKCKKQRAGARKARCGKKRGHGKKRGQGRKTSTRRHG